MAAHDRLMWCRLFVDKINRARDVLLKH